MHVYRSLTGLFSDLQCHVGHLNLKLDGAAEGIRGICALFKLSLIPILLPYNHNCASYHREKILFFRASRDEGDIRRYGRHIDIQVFQCARMELTIGLVSWKSKLWYGSFVLFSDQYVCYVQFSKRSSALRMRINVRCNTLHWYEIDGCG